MTCLSKRLFLVVLTAVLVLLPTLALAQARVSDDTWTVPGGGNNGSSNTVSVQYPGAVGFIRFDVAGSFDGVITSSMVRKATVKLSPIYQE